MHFYLPPYWPYAPKGAEGPARRQCAALEPEKSKIAFQKKVSPLGHRSPYSAVLTPRRRNPRSDRRGVPRLAGLGRLCGLSRPRRQRCLAHLIRKGIGLAEGFDYDAAHFGAWLVRELRGLIHAVAENAKARSLNPILARLKCRSFDLI